MMFILMNDDMHVFRIILIEFFNVVFPQHSTFFIFYFFRTMLRQQVIHLASTKYDIKVILHHCFHIIDSCFSRFMLRRQVMIH